MVEDNQQEKLSDVVKRIVADYLKSMGKEPITNLYDMTLEQIEPPLLEAVMAHTRYNQSKAAVMLGMSRGTLRTKLAAYFGDKYVGTVKERVQEG